MKYIKKFEGNIIECDEKFEVGDKIIATSYGIKYNRTSLILNMFLTTSVGEIYRISQPYIRWSDDNDDYRYMYYIKYPDVPDDLAEELIQSLQDVDEYCDDKNSYVLMCDQVRKATLEEIRRFELIDLSKKYNL